MDIKNRKNPDGKGLAGPINNNKVNPFILTQRQLLIQKLNSLLYKTQTNKISDEQVGGILRNLSHV
jgi:hypothetical protein